MDPAAVFGKLDIKTQEAVLEEIGREGAAFYRLCFDQLLESLGRPGGPVEDLVKFRTRPQPVWDAMEQEFPEQFKEQKRRWERLEKSHGKDVMATSATPAPVSMTRNPAAPAGFKPTEKDNQAVLQKAYERSQEKQLQAEYAPPKGAVV